MSLTENTNFDTLVIFFKDGSKMNFKQVKNLCITDVEDPMIIFIEPRDHDLVTRYFPLREVKNFYGTNRMSVKENYLK